MSTAASATGDFDGDGLADFYVTSTRGGNRLYRNLGDFRFQDVTSDAGLEDTQFWGTGATFVDIDNDGDLDIYACGYRRPNRLYINERRNSTAECNSLNKHEVMDSHLMGRA